MSYKANVGGHAPGHLRNAFTDFMDEIWDSGEPLPQTVDVGGDQKPLKWLLGQLWNCTDAIPAPYAETLDLEGTATYASAVRKVSEQIQAQP